MKSSFFILTVELFGSLPVSGSARSGGGQGLRVWLGACWVSALRLSPFFLGFMGTFFYVLTVPGRQEQG